MLTEQNLRVIRVDDGAARKSALAVLERIYHEEKGWAPDADRVFPAADLEAREVTWLLACCGDEPAGVVRLLYDPPLQQYQNYGLKLLDGALDVTAFLRSARVAEIGRFAVLPAYRAQIRVAAGLMAAAIRETVERGYTHYVTDVFEDDPHSPYRFHTRILGFRPVATHDHGELACDSRRITLILDLKEAYQRLKRKEGWLVRTLTGGWEAALHRRLDGAAAVGG